MSATTDPRRFVSVKQAAEILALSRWSVENLCLAGEITSTTHEGRRLVSLPSVHAWADQLEHKGA